MSAEPNVRTLTIDGEEISARSDQTILDAAREHNVGIPTLCHLEGLSEVGACRLCLVEVKGARRLLPACVTQVAEGMEITTHSPKIDRYRTMILELYFAERNHVCSVCVANGNCELQSLALSLGMTHVEIPYQYPQLPVDASHPRFTVDHNRCVLVHAVRARVLGDRGREHLGGDGPRRTVAGDHGSEAAVGRFGDMHQLRQVRAGVPDGCAV